jgi:nicotinamidase-related amidase
MNSSKTGLGALLTPDNCAAILIDHQPFQINTTTNVDPGVMINNVIGLAKTCKNYGVPTLLTTVVKDRWVRSLGEARRAAPDSSMAYQTRLTPIASAISSCVTNLPCLIGASGMDPKPLLPAV